MKIEEACKIAYDFLLEDGFHGFYLIIDIGSSWVFFGGDPKEVYYGVRTASVNKETGKVSWFASQLNENDELLRNGSELDVPNEYLYKAS